MYEVCYLPACIFALTLSTLQLGIETMSHLEFRNWFSFIFVSLFVQPLKALQQKTFEDFHFPLGFDWLISQRNENPRWWAMWWPPSDWVKWKVVARSLEGAGLPRCRIRQYSLWWSYRIKPWHKDLYKPTNLMEIMESKARSRVSRFSGWWWQQALKFNGQVRPDHFNLFLSDKSESETKEKVQNKIRSKHKNDQCAWAKYDGAVFFSIRHGSSDTVVSNGGIGQIHYQWEGTSLVAMLSLTAAVTRLDDDMKTGLTDGSWLTWLIGIDRLLIDWQTDWPLTSGQATCWQLTLQNQSITCITVLVFGEI